MERHRLLFVDDEEIVLRLLEGTFSESSYEIQIASSGPEALLLLESQPCSLVISDNKMPGMSGIELLSEVRRRWPDSRRLLLTGYADLEVATAAINEGGVHRFLTKPWNYEQLLRAVEEELERVDLIRETERLSALTTQQNRELLLNNAQLEALYNQVRQGILGTVQMFSALLETYDEHLGGHSVRVASLARDFATHLGLGSEQHEEIEMAACLHDVGLVCLPEHLTQISETLNPGLREQDRALIRRHPEYGQLIVSSNQQFEEIGRIIRAHHEHYDGSGYPDHLPGEAIPLGARVIAIISQYDRIAMQPGGGNSRGEVSEHRRREAIQYLRTYRGSILDPQLTSIFLEQIGGQEPEPAVLEVGFSDLREGMVLAEGISGTSGMLIIGPGTTLQPFHLARLESFNRIDPITQRIFVRRE